MEEKNDMHGLPHGQLRPQLQVLAHGKLQTQPYVQGRYQTNALIGSETALHKAIVKYESKLEQEQAEQSSLLPLEIEEIIIDLIASSSLRYLLFRMRLVSRRWIPRIDHRLFQTLSVTTEDYIKLLSLLHAQVADVKETKGGPGAEECSDCGEVGTPNSSEVSITSGSNSDAVVNEIQRIGQHVEKLTIFTSYRDPSIAARFAHSSSSYGSSFTSSTSSLSSSSSPSLVLSSFASLTTSPVSSIPPSPFHYEQDIKNSICEHEEYCIHSASYLPHLESIHLIGLTSSEMEKIPLSPNLKHIYLRKCTIKLSQIYRIITTARSLQSLRHNTIEVVVDIDKVLTDINANVHSQNVIASFGLDCTYLTAYSADFSGFPPPIHTMDTFLVPEGITTPALRNLCLKNIQVTSFMVVKRLIHASAQTLESLEFSFERYGDMAFDGRVRESLDLSQCIQLKHVTIDALKHDSSISRRNGLESTAIVLGSLPIPTLDANNATKGAIEYVVGQATMTRRDLTVSLHFPYEWQQGYEATCEIDRVLATNLSVTKVEIVLGIRYSDNSEIKAKVLGELPRSNARGIVEVCTEEPLQFPGWVFR